MRMRLLGAATALLAGAGAGLVAVTQGVATAATPVCGVVYTLNSWSNGFTADVKVTNQGAAVSSWTLGWTFNGNQQVTNAWNATVTQSGASVTAAIDHTTAHSGSTSLRVDGAAGYCNHVFVRNSEILGTTSNVWYVRYWVKHTTALPTSHTTAVAMQDANDGNKDLRFGGQNGAMQFNRASDDATLPEQSPAGVAQSAPLPTGTWNCVEFKVSGADGTIQTWLNDNAVAGLTEDGVPTHDIDGQWLNRTWRPKLTDLRLGWESYGEGADTLWYDDVAVGSQRVGC
jgi:hypothetical protein